jgi:hypothetical protein
MCRRFFYLISVLGLILVSTANAELVGWWKLDDGSGTTAIDSSGNGNDGVFVGEPQWVDGWLEGALEFDGDDYVDTGFVENMETWTIACWVTSPFIPSSRTETGPIHREQNFQINWDHGSSDWQGSAALMVGGSWHNARFDYLEANTWYHLAATYDGEELRAYTNGVLSNTNASMSGPPTEEPNSLKIAKHARWAQYFFGTVDDVQIYNHVLSEYGLRAIGVENYQQAWKPRPADGEEDVVSGRELIWNQGIINRETFDLYDEHQLYFGTDFNDVSSATVPTEILTDVNEFTPELDYDTTYYWRIDQSSALDPNSPVKGEVWSFTSANFIVVEGFENYEDFPPNEIFNTWIDGWGDPTNGATSGYPAPDFVGGKHYLDDEFVHGGEFSLPLLYDNSVGLSEVTRTLNADWTVDDVITLTLFYYGDASNAAEPMYVAIDGDAVVTNDDPKAALDNEWNRWDISLQVFADMGVDLTNVKSISIGFGDKTNPVAGGEGMVLIDDIRLYRSAPIEVVPGPEPVDPGMNDVAVYYDFENDTQDNSGNGRHGVGMNDPSYVSGATGFGSAINLNGFYHYVDLPIGSVINTLTECTITAWVNWSGDGNAWQRIFDFGSPPASADEDPQVYMFLTGNTGGGSIRFAMTVAGNSDEDQATASGVLPSRWHHVAVTIDPGNTTHTLYLDGKLVAQNTEARYTPSDLGQTTQNWIGRSQFSADPYFMGSIDEFYIFDRVLSENEILYLAGK